MVRIRLRRVGAKKKPTYRVVVADQRSPRDGRFIESIGHYDPRTDPPTVVIHEDRALHWLSVGAQPTGPVERFFAKLGLADKLKRVHGGESIDSVAAPRPGAGAATPAAPAKAGRGAKAAALADVPAEPSLADRAKGAAAAAVEAAEAGLDKAGDLAAAAADKAGDLAAAAADKAGDLAAAARDKAGDLAERAVEAAGDAAETVRDAAEPVVERTIETAKKVADVVSDAAETALDKAGDVAASALDKAGDLAATAAEKAADVVEAIADAVTGEDAAPAAEATELAGLGLSARVEKALVDGGVTSMAALTALLAEGDDKLLALPGIGAKAVEEIRERLGQAG